MVVGLYGRYCAGKNTVARLFEERGFLHLDADQLAHQALAEASQDVVAAFGPAILKKDSPRGGIDRAALAAVVFRDRSALARLEAIIHPRVLEKIERFLSENRGRRILINAPLLLESGLDTRCNAVLEVRAPLPLRFLRALRRDKRGPAAVAARICAQRGRLAQSSSRNADIMRVKNGGSSAGLRRRLAGVFVELRV